MIRVASSGKAGAIAWSNDARPHVVTPLAYRGHLYVCTDSGILTVYDMATGVRVNRVRIGGRAATFSASPVAADGRIYFASEDGDVFVFRAGAGLELLAVNAVGEIIFASPAIGGNTLVIRGRSHLFAFSK